ncbi:MAG: sulfur carrier protein ThiS [Pseudomonadota bacterium]|nr:sulfur carrier protein ThiS [Pseudomonadota bacterium]
MKLVINGESTEVATPESLFDLVVNHLQYPDESGRYIVAVNSELVTKDRWTNVALKDNDLVDILGVITGG